MQEAAEEEKQGWLQQQHGRPQNRGESAPPTKVTLKHAFGPPSLGRHKKILKRGWLQQQHGRPGSAGIGRAD